MHVGTLEVEARDSIGKGAARRLRRGGFIPGIVYGGGRDNRKISVSVDELQHALDPGRRDNTVISLTIRGQGDAEETQVMIKDFAYDALGDNLLHIDFVRISPTERVRVRVPLRLVGRAIGVQVGGKLKQNFRDLVVECTPDKIPEAIQIDVSPINVGENFTTAQIPVEDGTRVCLEPNQAIITITAPKKGAGEGAEAASE